MSEYKRARVDTLNQQMGNYFPHAIDLSKASLSQTLGYNPEGDTVALVLQALERGDGVRIFTKAVPHAKESGGVSYELRPLRDGQDLDSCLSVRIVDFARSAGEPTPA